MQTLSDAEKRQLAFAAMAARVVLVGWSNLHQAYETADDPWNPLRDDGDCARLESACEINVTWSMYCVESVCEDVIVAEEFAKYGGDKNKARRYASTRVAAELGSAMSA